MGIFFPGALSSLSSEHWPGQDDPARASCGAPELLGFTSLDVMASETERSDCMGEGGDCEVDRVG